MDKETAKENLGVQQGKKVSPGKVSANRGKKRQRSPELLFHARSRLCSKESEHGSSKRDLGL